MVQWLRNVIRLCGKEFYSLGRDVTLLLLIAYAFSAAIYSVAEGVKAEVSNATVAIVDADRSELTLRLRDAIQPPYFKTPVDIRRNQVDPGLESGRYIFVIEFPPNFERDVLAGRGPTVQLLIDATAMTQAGLGAAYLDEIFAREILDFLKVRGIESRLPVVPVTRTLFNPNGQSAWFTSVMQIVTNVTVLAIILVGAAVIREREHGTIEHLLVMPVRASEIAMAKILANGAVILLAGMLSLRLVVHHGLDIPLAGSQLLFMAGLALYLFAVTALGMLLATMAPTMPQFGLLAVPVYVVAYLLSGAATPVESMPALMQRIVPILPTTQFVQLAQAILYRGAGFDVVWPQFAAIGVCGALFLALALGRFRSMLARQG
ncbi:ABC transporter permease [Bordetella genomosp. 1]|uniref:ABC transmembrane type-2 domain-containing protein n=1 Tax=Bordetella genomosp. 1 TaxID=1395607 RepID=A0ABX4F6M6_9BORD|nr:ABC transporter permease [Bordetella genomosp. 1]MDQ8035017.1 ABC transporter permease [Bordetella sp.]OZI69041.1 hypothetical protein CAL27_06195 [Bordetella genomosp. 1]